MYKEKQTGNPNRIYKYNHPVNPVYHVKKKTERVNVARDKNWIYYLRACKILLKKK